MPIDDMDAAALRRRACDAALGIDWSRQDDHVVADFVAWAAPLVHGDGPTLFRLTPKLTVAAAAPPPPPARSRAAAAASPPPAVEPEINAAAQAQVLRAAARDGVPFCEECARAAARRAA